ncbi:MAG: GntR family transcriptional regulator [Candidatus Rokuibacteriota bacterium]
MQGFEALEVSTLADRALDRIETAIMKGDLAPGTRISEVLLARTFGISRGPLREAIRRLEGRGLLELIPHVGARVVTLSVDDLLEVFDIREALEGMACRLAAERMTDAEIAAVDAVLERHRGDEALRAGEAYYQQPGDYDFHYRIAQGAKNRRIVELLCGEMYHLIRIYRYRSGAVPGRAPQAFDEHRKILAALQARDGALAETLMREHIRRARTLLEQGAH